MTRQPTDFEAEFARIEEFVVRAIQRAADKAELIALQAFFDAAKKREIAVVLNSEAE